MTTSSRPAPTPPPAAIAGGALLLVLCPGLPLVAGVFGPFGSALPFVVVLVDEFVLLAALVWSLWRRWRRPHLLDRQFAIGASLASGVTLQLARLIADADGIRGSAVPRLRHGIPLPLDAVYVASCLAAGLVIVCGIVALILVIVLPAGARRARERAQAPAGDSPSRRGPVAVLLAAPRTSPELTHVTGRSDHVLRRIVSPVTFVLLVLAALASVLGLLLAAFAGDRLAPVGLWVVVLAPAVVSAWAVVESLWRADEEYGVVLAALVYRTLILPFLVAFPLWIVNLAVCLMPSVRHRFDSRPWVRSFWDGKLPETGTSMLSWVCFNALIALLLTMLGGLVLSIRVVMPVTAFAMPDRAIRDTMLSGKPEHRRQNIAAVRLLSLLLPTVFIAIALFQVYDLDDPQGRLAVVLSVAAAITTLVIWYVQRVDHRRRDRSSWHRRTLPNPHDPPPED